MIPDGWRETKIRDVAKIDVGRDLAEERFARTKSDTHRFPIYSNTVEQHGHYGFYDFPEYSAESVTVVGRGIGLGTAFARKTPFGAIGRLLVLSPKDDSFDVGYLADYLNHGFEIHYESGGIPQLPGKTLGNYSILLPPLPEQRRIAEILATWDRAIETVEALIANARAQKKALMQSLLTCKRRLPGFEGEWTETPIAKMGNIVAGGTPDSTDDDCWGGDIAWATPTDVTKLRTRHISRTERYITPLGLSSSATKRLPAGTVIVCTRATVGALAIATVPMTTNQGFKNIVPNDKHDSDFIYFLMSQNKKALIRAAGGSTFAEVSKADFEKLTFRVPLIDEQRAIAAVLICADTAFEKLESKLAALRQEKSALMQQLLTGKRRVKVVESEAA